MDIDSNLITYYFFTSVSPLNISFPTNIDPTIRFSDEYFVCSDTFV